MRRRSKGIRSHVAADAFVRPGSPSGNLAPLPPDECVRGYVFYAGPNRSDRVSGTIARSYFRVRKIRSSSLWPRFRTLLTRLAERNRQPRHLTSHRNKRSITGMPHVRGRLLFESRARSGFHQIIRDRRSHASLRECQPPQSLRARNAEGDRFVCCTAAGPAVIHSAVVDSALLKSSCPDPTATTTVIRRSGRRYQS